MLNQKPDPLIGGTNDTRNPLVSITTVTPCGFGWSHERAMGFVTDLLPGGLRLIATCWHSHNELWRNKKAMIAIVPSSSKEQRLPMLGKAIVNIGSEEDLLFILAKDAANVPASLFSLGADDLLLENAKDLYNARNVSETQDTLRFLVEIWHQEPVEEFQSTAYTKRSRPQEGYIVPWDNLEEGRRLLNAGWVPNRILSMRSRKGCSGSPIWDNANLLYGMGVRGSEGEDSDELICLPTSVIYKARQSIEGRLQKRLRDLGVI